MPLAAALSLLCAMQATNAPPALSGVEIGGRVMFDAAFVGGPGTEETEAALGEPLTDGAEIRRARLDARARLAPDLRGWLALEFAGGSVRFREASLAWSARPDAEWKLGYFKVPFFLDASSSSNDFDLLEQPASEEALIPGRNAGFGWSTWGEEATASAVLYRRVPDRSGVSADESYGAALRGTWRPWGAPAQGSLLHLAADLGWERADETAAFSARPENHLLPEFLDTGDLAADAVLRAGCELGWRKGSWHGAAEWMRAGLDADASGDPVLDGWTVSAGHFLTGEERPYDVKKAAWSRVIPAAPWGETGGGAWEVVGRWSALDFREAAAGEMEVQTLGLVWYATAHLRAYLDLQRITLDALDPIYAAALRVGFDF